MGRKQVLVQLDDDLVDALDQVAATEGISRSELIRRGARAALEAHKLALAERQHTEAYRRVPQDPVMTEVLRRAAEVACPDW